MEALKNDRRVNKWHKYTCSDPIKDPNLKMEDDMTEKEKNRLGKKHDKIRENIDRMMKRSAMQKEEAEAEVEVKAPLQSN